MERPRSLGPLKNSMSLGLTGGRSLVISSTVFLSGQAPSGTGKGRRSCSVCGAPRPSLTPSSAGVKMGKGRVFLLGSSRCSLTPRSTVPTLKTPEGHVCFSERTCHWRDSVSLRESSFWFTVCLQGGRPARLPPPRRSASPGRCTLASSLLGEDLGVYPVGLWIGLNCAAAAAAAAASRSSESSISTHPATPAENNFVLHNRQQHRHRCREGTFK
ncbi:hypothetical protein EYF80_061922 [Liparis tanakae]|uniref:Uncharacterized protein n=1 Tax=Liparis tanakae TaxID=230148 RepID=A0A4Z2EH99_9TELE|nr:hypothetical protein EYF80_061922 [Liparis tanakae]